MRPPPPWYQNQAKTWQKKVQTNNLMYRDQILNTADSSPTIQGKHNSSQTNRACPGNSRLVQHSKLNQRASQYQLTKEKPNDHHERCRKNILSIYIHGKNWGKKEYTGSEPDKGCIYENPTTDVTHMVKAQLLYPWTWEQSHNTVSPVPYCKVRGRRLTCTPERKKPVCP